MGAFLIYILKTSICLTIFYICIKAFLSKETFHRFNRLVILTGTSACMLLPLIRVEIPEYSAVQKPLLLIEEAFIQDDIAITEHSSQQNIFIADSTSITEKGNIDIGTIILIVYIAGGFINLTILLSSVYSMFHLIHTGSKLKTDNNTFIIVPKDINPFSWGKYIVLSEMDYNNNPTEIIIHETAHIKHHHSIDLIFMESVILFQWFNPAVWLLKRELKDIHEYQADISVLQSGINATKYQLLLVKKAVGTSSYTLANSFNHSKIKKRITMMLKEKSSKWARLKLLLLLPSGILTMFAFGRTEVNEPLSSLVRYESTDNLSEAEMLEKKLSSSANDTENQTKPKHTIRFTPPKITKDKVSSEVTQRKQQRDSLNRAVNNYINQNGYTSEAKVGTPPRGKFKIMTMTYTGEKEMQSTVFPEAYSKKENAKESDFLRIYWYVIDGKKYSWNKFMDKCRNGKVFFDRSKINAQDNEIIQLHGITTDGAETPIFYMVSYNK